MPKNKKGAFRKVAVLKCYTSFPQLNAAPHFTFFSFTAKLTDSCVYTNGNFTWKLRS